MFISSRLLFNTIIELFLVREIVNYSSSRYYSNQFFLLNSFDYFIVNFVYNFITEINLVLRLLFD